MSVSEDEAAGERPGMSKVGSGSTGLGQVTLLLTASVFLICKVGTITTPPHGAMMMLH